MNTTYFLNVVAGNLFHTKTTPTIPSELWIGLSTTAPNINGTNVAEPSASTGYARVKLDMLGEPVDGIVSNTTDIVFNESTESWGVVTHFVIFDAPSGGNLLQYDSLPVPNDIDSSTIMRIKQRNLELFVQSQI